MRPVWPVFLCLLISGLSGPLEPLAYAQGAALPALSNQRGTDETDPTLKAIRRRIERMIFYPDEARRRGIEGTVELEFTLLADGHVQQVWLLRSSGSSILDEAAVQVVKRAAPYPIVEDWPAVLRFQLPITYRLK